MNETQLGTITAKELKTKTPIKLEEPANTSEMAVIARTQISGVHEMKVEDEVTYLGEVRNFKNVSYFKNHLPQDFSISWTKMPQNKELPAHFHPCSSLILITKGNGESTGDTVSSVKAGDIVYIPEWNLHGFKGLGDEGFEALSIQFQANAIFESSENPETTYIDREKIPLEDRQLTIVSRDKLETIKTVSIAGKTKDLGVVKNFRSDPDLSQKLPQNFSAAWVHLSEGQVLDTHTHQTDSMIIITEGSGEVFGDIEQHVEAGDTVYVPAGCHHGFRGRHNGFWALSIQFENHSLYEDPNKPQVHFESSFSKLIRNNERLAKSMREKNPVFEIPTQSLLHDSAIRKRFFDGLQIMSNHFQKIMYARMAFCDSPKYQAIFLEHFLEELGHNTELEKERGEATQVWDPILEASAAWFVSKNLMIDNPGRIVLVQMILEKGASLFYSHFNSILVGDKTSDHIAKHCEADEGHDSFGVELLLDESDTKIDELQEIAVQGWSMLDLFLRRLAEYTLATNSPNQVQTDQVAPKIQIQ